MRILYVILLISCYLCICNAQCYKDTLSLLTADSIKYWDFDIDEGGVLFRSDSCLIEYDLDRYYIPPCINSPFFKKLSFIDGNLTIPLFDYLYKVLTIDEVNMILISKEDTLCLHKSEDQKTAIQTLPEIRYGYVAAKPIDIENFQTNILIPFFKDGIRKNSFVIDMNELSFVAEFRITKDGIVKSVHVIKSNFHLQQNSIFENHLIEVLKRIKFTPAKNEYTGEYFDSTVSYSMKVILERKS